MTQKIDYRVMLTQKMFKTAFLQLLTEKPIQEITIRELCAAAGVNRGTFYSHYQDIYDLLEQIEAEMFRQLQQMVGTMTDGGADFNFYYELFEFFQQNSEMCTMLLGKNSDRRFVDKLLNYGKEIFLGTYGAEFGGDNDKYVELFYEFVSGGCVSLLKYWITNGMKDTVEEMSKLLEAIITNSAKGMLGIS